MSRVEVPLLGNTVWQTGDVLLRAELNLLLKDNRGVWKPERFRVDSGADITMMPAAVAKLRDLPFPARPISGPAVITSNGQVVTEIRAGMLRVQVLGMDGTEYHFPCFFLGDPNAAAGPGGTILPRNLLGLGGVLDHLKIGFEKKVSVQAPHGVLVVEKL